MTMRRTMTVAMILGFMVIGLGCRPEPRATTLHEPGVYKGQQDPLLARQQHQELVDRLKLVQKDR
jgi:hypothetical protein